MRVHLVILAKAGAIGMGWQDRIAQVNSSLLCWPRQVLARMDWQDIISQVNSSLCCTGQGRCSCMIFVTPALARWGSAMLSGHWSAKCSSAACPGSV